MSELAIAREYQSQGKYFGPAPSSGGGGAGGGAAGSMPSAPGGGAISDSGPLSPYSGAPIPGTYTGPKTSDTHGLLRPETAAGQTWIQQHYPQFNNIGGYRQPDGFNEHSSGSALDVMLPSMYSHGDQRIMPIIQDVFKNNSDVDYILYNQTQWNRNGTSSPMDVRGGGNDTDNHRDHFHVHFASREDVARVQQIVARYGSLYGIEDQRRWVDAMISQISTGPKGCSWPDVF